MLATLIGLAAAAAGQLTVLHRFRGGTDGDAPYAGLIMEANGALYGATAAGGTAGCIAAVGCGTVFTLTPPPAGETHWIETVLHRFRGGSDGEGPHAGLITDANGALYGTTYVGGTSGCNCGIVFMLTPPAAGETHWIEKVLYRFKGGADGSHPNAGLIMDARGALYGTTVSGGGGEPCFGGCGTVFELTPPAAGGTGRSETVLHPFRGGSDGSSPYAGLIMDANGVLYGTTVGGGTSGCDCGIVFMLTPPAAGETRWIEKVLYRFQGHSDGADPQAGLTIDANGALYGTTVRGGGAACRGFGCGTAFVLTPPAADGTTWAEKVLYRFRGSRGGANPFAGLIIAPNGALYGTTPGGDAASNCPVDGGCGTVFKLVP